MRLCEKLWQAALVVSLIFQRDFFGSVFLQLSMLHGGY